MKTFIKRILQKVFNLILKIRRKLSTEAIRHYKREYFKSILETSIILKGENIKIDDGIKISEFRKIIIGNNVTIGKHSYFDSIGGITIGDNSKIGQCCKFFTTDPTNEEYSNSIYLGKNVIIGNDVTINPKTIISDNSIIPSGTNISGFYKDGVTRNKLKNEDDLESPKFFIVSTGRSGSASIAEMLNLHPEISCYHEPRGSLIRLSTQYEHGEISYGEVLQELEYLYSKTNLYEGTIYGESDQKLSNLIEPLAELFPEAKFIWLIRDAKKVTKSTTLRGWFDEDYTFPNKYRGTNLEGWKEYRLSGYKSGIFAQGEWESMSTFEKNCWYWNYWNTKISNSFSKLKNDNKFILKLEDLEFEITNVQRFIGVANAIPLSKVHKNKVKKIHKSKEDFWTIENEEILDYYCGSLNREFYNNFCENHSTTSN